MDLKELLGDQHDEIIAKLDGKTLMVNDGSYIPKSRLDEEIAKKKKLDDQLKELQDSNQTQLEEMKTEYEKQITDMTNKLKDFEGSKEQKEKLEKLIEESSEQLKTLTEKREQEKEEYEKLLNRQKFDATIEMALVKSNARKTKAVRALLDESKISLDGENLLGLNDQLEALKESDPYLFGETKVEGSDPKDADPPTPNDINMKKIGTMSVDDIVKNFDKVMDTMRNS